MEHADVVGRQELHELGVIKGIPLTVKDGGNLAGDVQDFPSDQGHSRSEHILERKNTAQGRTRQGPGRKGTDSGRRTGRELEGQGPLHSALTPSTLLPLTCAGVQTGCYLKKHTWFHCQRSPGVWIPCGRHLLSLPGNGVPGVWVGLIWEVEGALHPSSSVTWAGMSLS